MASFLFKSVLVTVLLVGLVLGEQEEEGGKCERIRLPLCQDLGYNWTAMPNLVGHRNQKEAEEAVSSKFFSSSIYSIVHFSSSIIFGVLAREGLWKIIVKIPVV